GEGGEALPTGTERLYPAWHQHAARESKNSGAVPPDVRGGQRVHLRPRQVLEGRHSPLQGSAPGGREDNETAQREDGLDVGFGGESVGREPAEGRTGQGAAPGPGRHHPRRAHTRRRHWREK